MRSALRLEALGGEVLIAATVLDDAQLAWQEVRITILPVLQAGEVLQPRLIEGSKGLTGDGSHCRRSMWSMQF